jgi:hypothetical protein
MNPVFAVFSIFWEWLDGIYIMIRDTIYDIAEMREQYKKYSRKEGIEYYAYVFGHTFYLILEALFYIIALTVTSAVFLLFMTLVIMIQVAFYSVIIICGLLFLFAGLS